MVLKRMPVFLLALAVTAAGSAYARGGKSLVQGPCTKEAGLIELPVSIREGTLRIESRDRGDEVTLEGLPTGGAPGCPGLPVHRFAFLFPPDVAWSHVEIVLENPMWRTLPGTYDVPPVLPPAPGSGEGNRPTGTGTRGSSLVSGHGNPSVYNRDAWYPAHVLTEIKPSQYRGYKLGRFELWPVQYNPATDRLRRLVSGTIVITYGKAPVGARALRERARPSREKRFWERLEKRLVNPGHKEDFYESESREGGPASTSLNEPAESSVDPDYVIVTTSNIQDSISTALNDFVDHKESRGFQVSVITESSLSENDEHYAEGSSGKERALNIRSWLQDRFLSWGIAYVLLIGRPDPTDYSSSSSTLVPMLRTYPNPDGGSTILTDLCYAELSGDWDLDGDDSPGEWDDDFGSGGIDRDFEIAVGRIPYYGSSQAEAILQKIVDYEKGTGGRSWRRSMLTGAAILNHSPEDHNQDGDAGDTGEFTSEAERTYGDSWGEAMKAMATDNSCSPYTLYEKEGAYDNERKAYPDDTTCDQALSRLNFTSAWENNPFGFVAYWGHGNSTAVCRRVWDADDYFYDEITQHDEETSSPSFFTNSDCNDLDDSHPSFVVQVACSNGDPASDSNLGYSLLKNGAVGTVSASAVTWYSVGAWDTSIGGSYGDNASYAYCLFKRMLENRTPVGDALNGCRTSFNMGWGWESWANCVAFNLRGDPSVGWSGGSPSIAPWLHLLLE